VSQPTSLIGREEAKQLRFSKADNPILYASDGFVSVTGYSRTEVVPRNCRFLQGNYTDKTATKRLKLSIDAREETVELLLNYKKTGEPFWNLLYVGKPLSSIPFATSWGSHLHHRSTIVRCGRESEVLHWRADKLLDNDPKQYRRLENTLNVR